MSTLPFSGQIYEISPDLNQPLIIEDFDITKDSIQLPANAESEVIPQFSFSDRYILTEINGDTAISTLTGELLAVVKNVTGIKIFTGYTEKGTYSLVSLENEFFSTYLEPNFFEPWYLEFDQSDYDNSVQKAIDAGLVSSAYEHYLFFGQFEAREDGLFAPTTDGNNTLYGSGYENGLVGVPISEGFYTRDVKPITTGVGEIDTLIGAPGEDTFFLGNVAMLNDTPQPFYVGEGDSDYVLIKGFDQGSSLGAIFAETGYPEYSGREALTDRILLAGKPYDYQFEKVGDDLHISFQDDLVAIIEDAPPLDQHFYIPGGTYVYTAGNVATFQGWGSENTLYEPFYFEENPGVEEAIANGEYESALDHLVKVGQFNPEGEVIFSGTSGDDAITGLGAASLLFGVEVTFVDGEKEGYRTATTGVGEADFAVGSFGVDTFVIGNDNILDPEKGSEVWYVGNGDEDYLTIQGFDPYKDFLFGAGNFADYTFEVVEEETDGYPFKSLEVNYQGDRVALIKEIEGSLTLPDLTSLIAFPLGEERPNGLALVAPQNEFLNDFYDTYIKPFFYEPLYPIVNPDVDALIAQGLYESYYDHLIKAGQFEDREDTMFVGTSGNDVMSGIGAESILVGVAVSDASYPPPDVKPASTGEGEIDTLLGSSGENIFALGNGLLLNDTAEAFYLGQGDNDYALIKGFDDKVDYLTMAGLSSDYTFTVVDGNVHIAKDGDLIAIVEGNPNLVAYPPSAEAGGFYVAGAANEELAEYNQAYFNEDFFLSQNPEAQEAIANGEYDSGFDYYLNNGGSLTATEGQQFTLWHGTGDRDFVGAFGDDAGLIGVTVTDFEVKDGKPVSLTTATNGTGERDFLYGAPGTNIFYLGTLGENPETFYVGNGDADYATILNFDPKQDYISLANDLADEVIGFFSVYDLYQFAEVDGNTRISTKDGDLVAVVEGVTGLKPFTGYTPDGATYLLSLENEFFDTYVKPSFFEPWYLEQDASDYDNSVQKAIDAGLVTDAYDHYLKIGQFEAREDSIFAGDEGDDTIYGTGAEPVLIGVDITEAVYARDNKPVTTGVGDVDTLIGGLGGDTFVLGNGTTINDAPRSYYVGQGDADYALIKGLSGSSVIIPNPQFEDATIDRLFLGGKHYDYDYETVDGDLYVSTKDGDLVAIVEDAPTMETPFSVPGATYIYGIDNVNAFDALWGASGGFYEPFYFAENPDVEEAIANGEYESAIDHYFKVGRFQANSEAIFHDPNNEGFTVGYGNSDLLFGVPLTAVDGDKEAWISATTGTGEQDFMIGGVGVTTYFIGNDNLLEPGKAPDVYYLGQGDEDYVFIQNFDPYKDFIFAVGKFEDYTLETVDTTQDVFGRIVPIKNLEISYQGDLVAVLNNVGGSLTVSELKLQEFSFGDERPNAFAFVAPQNEFLPSTPEDYFNSSVYIGLNPKVQKLIDKGQYESAYEYYTEVGDKKGHRAYFTGTANGNDNITAIGDTSTIVGVQVSGYNKVTRQLIINDNGSGAIDHLTGNQGINSFVLGNNGQSFYLGNGDQDYANIYNFDPLLDNLILAGDIIDYTFEKVDAGHGGKNLEISTKSGDLVAIVHDIGDLSLTPRPVAPSILEDVTVLASTENKALQKELADHFFAPYYAFNNPQAVAAVNQGKYKSVYDYYLKVGRFLEEGIQFTYWEGTSGNDIVTGLGDDIGLFGVDVTTIERQALVPHGIIGIETADTGVGTIDVLIGQAGGGETVFNLGKTGLSSNPNPTPFYVGEGDNDYALIKNFDPLAEEQFVSLVGTPADYTITQEDGNTRISYHDDLIAIVEGTPNLSVLPFFSRDGRFFLASLDAEGFAESTGFNFYEDLYLQLNPDVVEAIANGEYTSAFDHYAKVGRLEGREGVIFNGAGIFGGNDIVTDLGGDGEAALIGVPITNLEIDEETEQFALETASNGTGEVDTLIGTEALNLFVLGKNGSLDNPTPTPFYVGNGDADYAKIWSFDATEDFLFLAGSLNDYIFEGLAPYAEIDDDSITPKWDKETKIYTKEGDLIAIIDGIDSLTPFPASNPGGFYLVSGENTHLAEAVESTFFTPYYLIQNPDVQGLIDSGVYTSAYDHFIKEGQFEKREDTFFNGTEGNDTIVALGYESIIAGVPISEASYAGGIDIKPTNLGSGQVDILMGGLGYESFIMLGNGTVLNDTPNSFYLGNGDADYALIKGFTVDYNFEEDRYNIYHVPVLGGDGTKYTYESIDGDTHISLNGDLVAIVEDVPILIPDAQGEGLTYLYSPDFDAWYTDTNTPKFFAEEAYLANNADVQALIDAGEYESGIDHFLHKGIFEEGRIAVYQGTAGNDNEVWGTGTSIIFGVEVTDIDTESLTFTTGSTGVGEVDLISGTPYANTFVLGNNGQSFYVGNGDEDYVTVEIFDVTKDRILLASDYEDYTFETVAGEEEGKGDLKILTKDGDLVAIVKSLGGKIADLKPFKGYTPEGSTYLVSLKNEFFSTYVEPYFFAPAYPVQNRDVDALIEAGEYTSYYDHFLKAGQFEEREDTFLAATEGNDTLYAVGWETILSGVPISAAQYREGLDVVPTNLGSGQIDTLYSDAGAGKETIFMLGNTNLLNDTAQSFYLGNGDADYALIKHFSPGDRIFLGSDIAGFTQTVVDGNLHIAKDGDLIAIVENRTELASDRANELTSLATESYTSGTDGDDIVFGSTRQSNIIGIPLANSDTNKVYATTTGVGEFDTLNGSKRGDYFYLGIATTPDGEAQPLYVGGGDADYALIPNFSNTEKYDSVVLAGKISDYKFEFEAYEGTGNDTKIYTKDGDLIGIVENTTLSQFYVDGNPEGIDIALYSVTPSGTAAEVADYLFDIEPFFYEDFYLDENPEVEDLIASGEYGSAFEHFIEVGQFAPESELILAGTEGDDFIPSMGKADLVFGVALTTVDGTVEGWQEASTGVGEKDTLSGGLGVTTFFIGNDQILDPSKPNTVYYVGEGDEDYALIQGFQPTQDFIFGAGSIDEYTFETFDGDLKISYGSDLVAIVDDAGDLTLQAFPLGDERPRGLALVAPENQFLTGMG